MIESNRSEETRHQIKRFKGYRMWKSKEIIGPYRDRILILKTRRLLKLMLQVIPEQTERITWQQEATINNSQPESSLSIPWRISNLHPGKLESFPHLNQTKPP
jgi:hypothetical protein